MPANIERCVKEVMKKQGVSESSAWAICNAAVKDGEKVVVSLDRALSIGEVLKSAEKGIYYADSRPITAKLDPITGFLTAPVKLARTGVQYYYGFELGLKDRMMDKIGVLRPSEEVFHPDSVESFINLIVTDDHPSDLVTVDNVKSLQIGMVSDVKPKDEVLHGVATITDKTQIQKIQKGKKEVSVGYTHKLIPAVGKHNGVDYEFKQTEIRANHLAIVDAGRCGPSCQLTIDNKNKGEDVMFTITIDGIQYKVEDAQLFQAVQKLIKNSDESMEEMKKKMDEMEEELKKAKASKDQVQAQLDAASKEKLTDEQLGKLVADRAVLIADAKEVLGDKMPECMTCPAEIKTAVIDEVLPEMELDGKSEDYINAAYDMAIAKFKKAKKSVDKLGKDLSQFKKEGSQDRQSARDKYMKDQLGITD